MSIHTTPDSDTSELTQRRERLNLSPRDLAALARPPVSHMTIRRAESGKPVTAANLAIINMTLHRLERRAA